MKRRPENYVTLEFLSRSSNEGFARLAAAAFAAQLDPTLDELGDIKTAVSEAVTNAIGPRLSKSAWEDRHEAGGCWKIRRWSW